MGKPAARIDDSHLPNGERISSHTSVDQLSVGLDGEALTASPRRAKATSELCRPVDIIATGSTSVSIGGQPAARVGDKTHPWRHHHDRL